LRVGLDGRRAGDPVLLHGLFDVRGVAVRRGADGLIDHDLENQVRAALEIKTELDALEERFLEGGAGEAAGNAGNAQHADDEHDNDEDGFISEVLMHGNEESYLAASSVVTEAIALLTTSIL